QGSFGKIVTHSDATGPITVVVAADGSLGGTWSLTSHETFDENVSANGVTLNDHRDSTLAYAGGVVTGTACDPRLQGGSVRVLRCVDSIKGDCSGERPPTSTPVPLG